MRIQSTFISDESGKASLLICLDENSTIEDETNYDYLRDYQSVSPYGEIVHNWIYGQDYRQLDQLVITAPLPVNRFDVIIRTPIDFLG